MREIDRLYARIPKVLGCKTACSDCCGPVPMNAGEAASVTHMLRPEPYNGSDFITPIVPGCLDCAYSTREGCSIYEHRPLMCRLFGAVEGEPRMTCPHGAKAKRPLTREQAAELVREYMELSV